MKHIPILISEILNMDFSLNKERLEELANRTPQFT